MFMLGPVGFATPLLLLGLIGLPILWLLLRAVPPAPIRRRFPGVALLLGLQDDDAETDKTPWWLLLLRMLAVAAAILGFAGPILALQSEDHYVRVHGQRGSELILMRLRDAIAEMEGVAGAQVHRSWWIAHRAILRCDPAGRSWLITLDGGLSVPVARDSVARLQRAGFLPAS